MDQAIGRGGQGFRCGLAADVADEAQWLDRRERMAVVAAHHGGWRALRAAWKTFVTRMQLGPVSGEPGDPENRL